MNDGLNLNLGNSTTSINNQAGTAIVNGLAKGLGATVSKLPLMDMFFPHVKANEINQKNYELQQGQFEYEKALQQQIFDREDTAVQRRLNDVTKAGFSPLAALGQSAGAGQVVSTTAPQRQYTMPDTTLMRALGSAGLEMLSLQNELENGAANRELIQEQARSLGIDNKIKEHNFNYYSGRGMPTNMTGVERLIIDIANSLGIDTGKILSGETAETVIKTVGNGTPLEKVDNIVSGELDEKIPQRLACPA